MGGVFENSGGLESVTLPEDIDKIPLYAFCGCKSLKSIKLPKNCKKFQEAAFALSGLESIEIPEACETIEDYAFYGTKLKTVELSANVKEIGKTPWRECKSLTSIDVDPNNPCYASINGVLYDKNFTTLLLRPYASKSRIEFPSTLKIIGEVSLNRAAYDDLVIPEGVETIEYYGIPTCKINTLTLPSTLVNINEFQKINASLVRCLARYPARVYTLDFDRNMIDSKYFMGRYSNTILEVASNDIYLRYKDDLAWSSAFPNMKINKELLNSGISDIDADETDGQYEYFTMEGLRVPNPLPGQILIRRHNGKVEKIRY